MKGNNKMSDTIKSNTTETKKEKEAFLVLNTINVSDKTKEKNKLTYLPWAAAWEAVKRLYPDATFEICEQIIDEYGNKRFWFTDGATGWVKVTVTIEGISLSEVLPIMNFRNEAIPADKITSTDANKTFKRCLVKCLALHGLGTYVYLGEDLPEEESKSNELKDGIKSLIDKKVSLSDKAKSKVAELCRKAEKEANPDLEEELITGNYKNIDDVEILEKLKKQLMAIRK